ncbi:hypothetical protein [Flavobacterium soyae]|uniref:DUF2975 domain-containing protein n=1 Tax=Flavobacterium soyae TaxID=2903098 RepID=A0ABZ2UC29_9FLAO
MSIRTFWVILIKILGLLLISGALTVIPQWFTSIFYTYQSGDVYNMAILASLLLIILFVYFFIFKICMYKTSWIIDKLKLDKGFDNETLELNSSENKIISIAVIVIGGLMFVENIPVLLREMFVFFQDKNLFKDYPKAGWIIFDFCKVILGYLLMTNSFRITNFIRSKKE